MSRIRLGKTVRSTPVYCTTYIQFPNVHSGVCHWNVNKSPCFFPAHCNESWAAGGVNCIQVDKVPRQMRFEESERLPVLPCPIHLRKTWGNNDCSHHYLVSAVLYSMDHHNTHEVICNHHCLFINIDTSFPSLFFAIIHNNLSISRPVPVFFEDSYSWAFTWQKLDPEIQKCNGLSFDDGMICALLRRERSPVPCSSYSSCVLSASFGKRLCSVERSPRACCIQRVLNIQPLTVLIRRSLQRRESFSRSSSYSLSLVSP